MKPTDILKNEHRQIERMLDVLEINANKLMKGENISPQFFLDAVKFLQIFADRCHHNKEEKLLFPEMSKYGIPVEGGPIGMMLLEHEEGRGYVRNLKDAATKYSAGDSTLTSDICRDATAFIHLLRAHIQKEDQILFMMADVHIPESEQHALMHEFTNEEKTGAACMQKESLLVMLDQMEAEYFV